MKKKKEEDEVLIEIEKGEVRDLGEGARMDAVYCEVERVIKCFDSETGAS